MMNADCELAQVLEITVPPDDGRDLDAAARDIEARTGLQARVQATGKRIIALAPPEGRVAEVRRILVRLGFLAQS